MLQQTYRTAAYGSIHAPELSESLPDELLESPLLLLLLLLPLSEELLLEDESPLLLLSSLSLSLLLDEEGDPPLLRFFLSFSFASLALPLPAPLGLASGRSSSAARKRCRTCSDGREDHLRESSVENAMAIKHHTRYKFVILAYWLRSSLRIKGSYRLRGKATSLPVWLVCTFLHAAIMSSCVDG